MQGKGIKSQFQEGLLMIALSKSEVREILSVIDLSSPFGRRDYLLILFLFHTGLRVGECAGLIIHLVALGGQPRQYLHLPAAVCKGSRGRVVPLNRVAQACILKILAFNESRGFSTAPAAPLFQNRVHGPLSVRSIQQMVASYRELAGLDVRATPHTFRHSHASQLVAAGVPTVHIQKVLGHRHLSSTQVYCHLSKEQLLESSRALE
jgi:site-specific recombinase XerD